VEALEEEAVEAAEAAEAAAAEEADRDMSILASLILINVEYLKEHHNNARL
jgi:hypothetical protein